MCSQTYDKIDKQAWWHLDIETPNPVLQQESDAVTRLSANGSAAFNESCTTIG